MPASIPSLRELARTLGLSHTTVSEALRGSPRVVASTRERVLAAAEAAGYRRNPLAGALMSELRRSRGGTFRGMLAIIDLEGPQRRPAHALRFNCELVGGAIERAEQLGFKVESFVLGRRGLPTARADTILQSRGIRGLFLLPVATPDLLDLDWNRYSGVYADYIIEKPPLNSVCSDHYRSMMTALKQLQSMGYARPGLVLHRGHDDRLLYRWEAGFEAHLGHSPGFEYIKPLIVPELTQEAFTPWFLAHKPDVVLCHRSEAIDWMEACGAHIPQTHGYCCLNVKTAATNCAGLDLQPRLLGARGMETLIAQLHRNEYGVPTAPSTTTIPGVWQDGPTLRSRVERIC